MNSVGASLAFPREAFTPQGLPLDKLSQCDYLDHKLDSVCCRSHVGVPEGLL